MPPDPHSFSEPEKVRTRGLDLDLTVDFERRILEGAATWSLERPDKDAPLVLDVDGPEILEVADAEGGPLDWELGPPDPVLGRPLRVRLGPDTERVRVRYATRPDAKALQWLDPEQTRSHRPFLFTQGQAILTRTWLPCQDSPGIRFPWRARVVVPEGLKAVMSAAFLTPEGEPVPGGRRFRFEMDRPVPPYLIALAVGDLAFRDIGPRSGVFAEPPIVDEARYEFADTERMIETAERLYGPYLWGRYDILVLPPAFPFGGMENPRLTFATPTILAGDRSLVSLIAHELAHSWSGNLVTNATWEDLWLNEGFTVYFENRIMEALEGPEYARMLQVLGWQDLLDDIEELGPESPDTCLRLNLAGRNPDDAFSDVPYEKGALFLRTVERIAGRDRFDRFLRSYFERHAFGAMTSERFLAELREELFADDPEGWKRLDAERWVYEPGLPPDIEPPRSARLEAVARAARDFLRDGAPPEPWGRWSTHERVHFLRALQDRELPSGALASLDRAFDLSNTGNSEVLFEWLRLCVAHRYESAFPALRSFLVRQGRRKFLKPLYQDLCNQGPWGVEMARSIYEEARRGYHAVSRRTIEDILSKAGGS